MIQNGEAAENLRNAIYDWNIHEHKYEINKEITIDDETLRDGLQSPSVRNPGIVEKQAIIRSMTELGIQTADLGLPGAGEEALAEMDELIGYIVENDIKLLPRAACRTHRGDIEALAKLTQKHGTEVYCDMFIASSAVRRYAESWSLEDVKRKAKESLEFTQKEGMSTMFVLEDTTRTKPEEIETMFLLALEHGVKRLCITDTVGFATPEGTRAIVKFTKDLLKREGLEDKIGLDWHGHRDRGLALSCTLAAIEAGVDQVHGCALGIGERTGNTALELILVNL